MSVMYEPRGRAREYAPLAVNHYRGCSHGCKYCYVPTIPPYKFNPNGRREFHASPSPRPMVVEKLERECRRMHGHGERVLLSFTTDPYQPIDTEYRLTRAVIETLHRYGYAVQILTKGGTRSLCDLDCFMAADAYAATMTTLSDVESKKWEPLAALPADRIEALGQFHAAGIPTWVSLEPVLDPGVALQIIRETHTFVDLFKIGKLNHHQLAEEVDWRAFALDSVGLCESLEQPYYIKRDLAALLPRGGLGKFHVAVADIERVANVATPCLQPSLI